MHCVPAWYRAITTETHRDVLCRFSLICSGDSANLSHKIKVAYIRVDVLKHGRGSRFYGLRIHFEISFGENNVEQLHFDIQTTPNLFSATTCPVYFFRHPPSFPKSLMRSVVNKKRFGKLLQIN